MDFSRSPRTCRHPGASFLILGGGYIALEMGTVYASLGAGNACRSGDRLLRGADPDLAGPLIRRLKDSSTAIHFNTHASSIKEKEKLVEVTLEGEAKSPGKTYDRVLIAMGRAAQYERHRTREHQGEVNEKGLWWLTNSSAIQIPKIFAVGESGQASPCWRTRAVPGREKWLRSIAGEPSAFDVRAIPAVVYTDPQVAWAGLTEEQARKQNRPVAN